MLLLLLFIAGTFAGQPGNFDSCERPETLTTGTYYIKGLPERILKKEPKEDLFHPIDADTAGKFVPFLQYKYPSKNSERALHAEEFYDENDKTTGPPVDSAFHVEADGDKLRISSEDQQLVVSTAGTNVLHMYPAKNNLKDEFGVFTYNSKYELKYEKTRFQIYEMGPSERQISNIYVRSQWKPNMMNVYNYANFCFQKKSQTEHKNDKRHETQQNKNDNQRGNQGKKGEGKGKGEEDTKGEKDHGKKKDADDEKDGKTDGEHGKDGESKKLQKDPENSIYIIKILASVLITAFLF